MKFSPGHPVFALATAFAVLTGCSKPSPEADVLAQVGERKIRVADLQAEVEIRRQSKRPVPDQETLLRELVEQEALVQRARQAGVEKDPRVQREMQVLLIGKLRDLELAPRTAAITVSDDEIKAEYERHIARYSTPPKARLSMLFQEVPLKSSEAKRAEAMRRLAEARAKALANPATGFTALALDYSDDQASRYRGGDLGWLDAQSFEYHWPRAVLEKGYALAKGGVSDVIEADGGLYLVAKTDFREGTVTSFAQAKPSLQQSLLVTKRRLMEEKFRAESVALALVKWNLRALSNVALPEPPPVQKLQPPALPGTSGLSNNRPRPALPGGQ